IEFLQKKFIWPKDVDELEEDGFRGNTPEQLLEFFIEKAIKRHKQHVDNFHRVWGKEVGFSSRRGARRIRYAPQDLFLKSLVYCVVPKRMEFQEFLEELYDRYGFIIGERQAHKFAQYGQADLQAF